MTDVNIDNKVDVSASDPPPNVNEHVLLARVVGTCCYLDPILDTQQWQVAAGLT